MSALRWLLASTLALSFATLLPACPAPEPPKTVVDKPPSEEEADLALIDAKKSDDVDAYFAVHRKYGQFVAGKKALRLAVRKLLESAIDQSEKCKMPEAAGSLASVAPYTADDKEIDEAYDETKQRVDGERKRCFLVKLDEDVKRAEASYDWPRVFNRIETEKEVDDSKALSKRRVDAMAAYVKWLDETLKMIVSKKSVDAALDDKRDEFDASTDPSKLPPEVAAELAKKQDLLVGILLVFDKLQDGSIIDPPARHWTFGKARPRRTDAPAIVGPEMAPGISFYAVAKGKVDGITLLCWGSSEGNVFARLASIKALVPEVDARTFDTNTSLPEKLVGARVLAPIATGNDLLTPSIVQLEQPNGAIVVIPVSSTSKKLTLPKVATKKTELRGLVLPPGTPVIVKIGAQWKKAEVSDAPEEDRVLVKIGGFESYVALGDVRVSKKDLPKPSE